MEVNNSQNIDSNKQTNKPSHTCESPDEHRLVVWKRALNVTTWLKEENHTSVQQSANGIQISQSSIVIMHLQISIFQWQSVDHSKPELYFDG